MLKITKGLHSVFGCWELAGWAGPMLGGCARATDFPSSIDQQQEGGSSEAAVNPLACVRVQLSRSRSKPGVETKEVPGEWAVAKADLHRV